MQIEKNIAAMLQSKMKETGKTKLEFSKELGIPRSTLQGYLKGDKCLRSDSIEEIAKRLDLSPAQLISGPVYAEEFVLFSMDALQEVYLSGTRAEDMALRFLYAGFPKEKLHVQKDYGKLMEEATAHKLPVFVMPTYTAMLALRGTISKTYGYKQFWE